jgi:Flp pilus assembly pilin Flp
VILLLPFGNACSQENGMRQWHRAALAGQGLVEYALIILFVAIALVGALTTLGGALASFYQSAAGAIPGS